MIISLEMCVVICKSKQFLPRDVRAVPKIQCYFILSLLSYESVFTTSLRYTIIFEPFSDKRINR